MVDQNLTQLTETAELDDGDLAYVVRDPTGTAVDRKVTVATTRSTMATVVHQLDDRSWSADVPSRSADDPRYELRGWDDPADATNGIDTPANLTDLDVWLDLNQFGIAPPWES